MGYLASLENFDNIVTMTLWRSNYDSLIVRTVAFPVQVAYWI